MDRLDQPAKTWKFSPDDVRERGFWTGYMRAYEEAIASTATPDAPWYVVPADRKWFARLSVVEAVIEALRGLRLKSPAVAPDMRIRLDEARRWLETDD